MLPDGGAAGSPATQFARTPYAASFARDTVEFILTTAHIIWGASPAGRLQEITEIAHWMRAWADRPDDWNDNLLVLGDFNLDRLDDPLYQAFAATGLFPPAELNHVPRTIFDNDKTSHFYDQIAWFSAPDGTSLLALPDPHRPRRLVRLRPLRLRQPQPDAAVVADLRPLPALGGVHHLRGQRTGTAAPRPLRCSRVIRWG